MTKVNKAHLVLGVTASGKSDFAFQLAKQIKGAIICADSRQLYQGFEALSNKDVPTDKRQVLQRIDIGNWSYDLSDLLSSDGIHFYLFDSVAPQAPLSIAHYFTLVKHLLPLLESLQLTPIFVGGSWLYLKSLLFPPPTLFTPINESLRHDLQKFDTNQLQTILSKQSPRQFAAMNISDKNNPRRLIRAIEISQTPSSSQSVVPLLEAKNCTLHVMTNNQDPSDFKKKLQIRLENRLDAIIAEVQSLQKIPNVAPMLKTSIGVKICQEYLAGNFTRQELVNKIVDQEYQYSKRQTTFLKKDLSLFQSLHPEIQINYLAPPSTSLSPDNNFPDLQSDQYSEHRAIFFPKT